LGDGKGNLVADGFTYVAGNGYGGSPSTAFARLNYLAPAAGNDHAPDLLTFTNSGAASLLNQNNPTPEIRLGTTTALTASASTVNVGQSLTFTATVTGAGPTGSVSFVEGTSTLGTATITDGVATWTTSFAAAGTFSVTANYSGDTGNTRSNSAAVPITVVGPDFAITVSPESVTITDGQTATTVLAITPAGGYAGTVSFSCGALPSEAACTFTPSAVTPAGGAVVTTTLTMTTTAPSSALLHNSDHLDSRPILTIAAAGVMILVSPRRMRRWNRGLKGFGLWLVLIAASMTIAGCSGSSSSSGPGNAGTPTGTQTITVTAADAKNGLSHAIQFTVTIQ
jgi:hypothetical protein